MGQWLIKSLYCPAPTLGRPTAFFNFKPRRANAFEPQGHLHTHAHTPTQTDRQFKIVSLLPDVMTHAFNLRVQETEAGGSP